MERRNERRSPPFGWSSTRTLQTGNGLTMGSGIFSPWTGGWALLDRLSKLCKTFEKQMIFLFALFEISILYKRI